MVFRIVHCDVGENFFDGNLLVQSFEDLGHFGNIVVVILIEMWGDNVGGELLDPYF